MSALVPSAGAGDSFAVMARQRTSGIAAGCGAGGGAIDLEMHSSGCSFVEAMRTLIGDDAGTPTRRQPTPEEIKAREAREAQRRRDEAEELARKEISAAQIVACLQPIAGTPGEAYLRDVRRIDVSHWAIKRVLEDVGPSAGASRIRFRQDNPSKPGHELNGQWLGAIVGVLTDPITGERTGGITRTFIHQGRKICRAMSLGGVGRLGVIRLTPDEEVGTGLHLCEGIESALSAMMMGFCPMWAAGSTVDAGEISRPRRRRMPDDRRRQRHRGRSRESSRPESRARGLPAVGRRRPRGGDEEIENTRGRRQRHHQAKGARWLTTPKISRTNSIRKSLAHQAVPAVWARLSRGGGSRPKIEIRVGEMQRAVDEAEAALIVAQPSSPVEKKVFRRATGSSRWRPTKGPTTRAEQSRARSSSSSETMPSPSASRPQRPSRNGTAA